MNVELIKIPEDTARAKLRAYRKALATSLHGEARARVRREYEQIEAGYKAAARGLPLIELTKSMALGGWDDDGRPRFAVGRADVKRINCYVDNTVVRFSVKGYERRNAEFRFLRSGFPPRPPASKQWWSGEAIVPMVPPDVLPRLDLDLSRRVILWEADWLAAPADPLLLLPIGGDLYAVEAAWDLTALERAVISGR